MAPGDEQGPLTPGQCTEELTGVAMAIYMLCVFGWVVVQLSTAVR